MKFILVLFAIQYHFLMGSELFFSANVSQIKNRSIHEVGVIKHVIFKSIHYYHFNGSQGNVNQKLLPQEIEMHVSPEQLMCDFLYRVKNHSNSTILELYSAPSKTIINNMPQEIQDKVFEGMKRINSFNVFFWINDTTENDTIIAVKQNLEQDSVHFMPWHAVKENGSYKLKAGRLARPYLTNVFSGLNSGDYAISGNFTVVSTSDDKNNVFVPKDGVLDLKVIDSQSGAWSNF